MPSVPVCNVSMQVSYVIDFIVIERRPKSFSYTQVAAGQCKWKSHHDNERTDQMKPPTES